MNGQKGSRPTRSSNKITIKPIDLKDIPDPQGGNTPKWHDALLEFLQSGNACAVVSTPDRTAISINSCLRGAIKTLELQDKIKVFVRQSVVYLQRLPGADEGVESR